MDASSTRRIDAAVRAAIAGGNILQRMQGNVKMELTTDRDPTSSADRKAHQEIVKWLRTDFPNDNILGEDDIVQQFPLADGWTVDALDGTPDYLSGLQSYAVLLSYQRNSFPLIGIMYFPGLHLLVKAARGRGCKLVDQEEEVEYTITLQHQQPLQLTRPGLDFYNVSDEQWQQVFGPLTKKNNAARPLSECSAAGILSVLQGRTGFYFTAAASIWDLSPGQVAVEEAAGVCCRLDSSRWTYDQVKMGPCFAFASEALKQETFSLLKLRR